MFTQGFALNGDDHVQERCCRLPSVPGSVRKLASLVPAVGEPYDDEAVEHHAHWGGSFDCSFLAVLGGFEPEVALGILKRRFDGPPRGVSRERVERLHAEVRGVERLVARDTAGVADYRDVRWGRGLS